MAFLSRFRLALFLFLVSTLVLGCYLLVIPDNPLVRLFRGEISDIDANIVIGPYPTETDFIRLKKAKVNTIISLLDPALPYEKVLLAQERVLAQKYTMKFINFPMTSVLGYKMGQNYDSNAMAAAGAATASAAKSYVHCYLGIHRAKIVKNLVESRNQTVGNYLLREGERGQLARMQDQAEQLYNQGNYKEVKLTLSHMKSQNYPSTMLNAWTSYHLHNIPEARKLFANALTQTLESAEVDTGLAFCDLTENKLDDAWQKFSAVITKAPTNEAALSGAGLVLYRQGKLAESAQMLTRALAINPKDSDASETLQRIQNEQQS